MNPMMGDILGGGDRNPGVGTRGPFFPFGGLAVEPTAAAVSSNVGVSGGNNHSSSSSNHGNNHIPPSMAWYEAIQEATLVLRSQQQHRGGGGGGGFGRGHGRRGSSGSGESEEDSAATAALLDDALAYLEQLEEELEKQQEDWDLLPSRPPPAFTPRQAPSQYQSVYYSANANDTGDHHNGGNYYDNNDYGAASGDGPSTSSRYQRPIRIKRSQGRGGGGDHPSLPPLPPHQQQQRPRRHSSMGSVHDAPTERRDNRRSTTGGFSSSSNILYNNTNNVFASLGDDDDDDDDDDEKEEEEEEKQGGAVDENDDPSVFPPYANGNMYHNSNLDAMSEETNLLVMRRLVIRVVTAQAEVHAMRASQCRRTRPRPQWKQGADTYHLSLQKIFGALGIADAECARLLEEEEEEDVLAAMAASKSPSHAQSPQEQQAIHQHRRRHRQGLRRGLVDDAQVMAIAIDYLSNERKAFVAAARRQEQVLWNRLSPQWAARDEARARLGEDRWRNNPSPRNDHRQARLDDEMQLRDLRAAMEQLETWDTGTLHEGTQALLESLQAAAADCPNVGGGPFSSPSQPQSSNQRNNNKKKENLRRRDNGQRPTDLSNRVPMELYPDPTDYDWSFTGSWANTVEFFEKIVDNDADPDGGGDNGTLVKLDWYFTTGTVKTSLEHPTRGRTQLFGRNLSPEVYCRILQDPRHHTGQRYYRKADRAAAAAVAPLAAAAGPSGDYFATAPPVEQD